jgi:hypothetical protein
MRLIRDTAKLCAEAPICWARQRALHPLTPPRLGRVAPYLLQPYLADVELR